MLIIPAIDLQNGRCVRLKQGQFDRTTVYQSPPALLAKQYANSGATHLHVVDLDGAKNGDMQQLDLIKAMQTDSVLIQAGGGIRSIAAARACIAAGINRLVIGSMAVSHPELTLELIAEMGAENIVLALDVNIEDGIPKPAIHGWQTTTERHVWDVVQFYQDAGITQVLCTDIAQDGMMNGPNFKLYTKAIHLFPNIAWQASGGIRNINDIRTLASIGVSAVILGRILYEGAFNLSACLQELSLC